MFVFRKNTLKKQIVPVRGDEAAMHLIHEPSGVHLEFGFLTDPEVDIENDPKALSRYKAIQTRRMALQGAP